MYYHLFNIFVKNDNTFIIYSYTISSYCYLKKEIV